MRFFLFVTALLLAISLEAQTPTNTRKLSEKEVSALAQLPLKCLQQEYPNKLGQVLNDSTQLLSPDELHPVFYGCFDWHSSVHGHWLLVRLLKEFPEMSIAGAIREKLDQQFTAEKVLQEVAFFQTKHNESFERTYGWAWLLKLQEELITWEDPDAKRWSANLRPLADMIVGKYCAFLPKLVYPIRSGEHINTAFGLTFAYDYAVLMKIDSLKNSIETKARTFYLGDKNYPLSYEPSGYDFLSGGLEEVDLMRRVLTKKEFAQWLKQFLPDLYKKDFTLAVGRVSDRSDGKLVHLDGLNFSRAWCLYGLARYDERFAHLREIADAHMAHSLPTVVDGDYMGEHWLASFAVLALLERDR
jgi:urease accessory protein UreF